MQEPLTCVDGHQWFPPSDTSTTRGESPRCPICGKQALERAERAGQRDPPAATQRPRETGAPIARPAKPAVETEVRESAAPPPDVPGYEIFETLGRGGMGVVYKARHLKLRRVVALKMLASAALASDELRARFESEAQAAARLQHPHIAQIFEIGQWSSQPYLALEYISGGTLARKINAAPQPPIEAARLIETLARAIHYSHQQGILHRDLKPANILLTDDGVPKITDFGLAKWLTSDGSATRTGEVMGTPRYMAPEQASGVVKKIGPACDVYGLGTILYELLCGRPPFQTPDPVQTILLVLSEEPLPPRRLQPQVPRDLETICLKCLEKSPARRFSSGEELADDLARFCEGKPIRARPVRAWERVLKWARRRPATASLILLSILFVVTLLIGSACYNRRLQAELNRSEGLFSEGRDLADWVLYEHVDEIARLRGGAAVQEKLVTRFREYLDGLAQNSGDDMALAAEVAAAYERIGEVQGDPNHFNLGKTRAAYDSYRQALAIREKVLLADPDDFAARWHRAACLGRIASVLAAMGKRQEARQRYDAVVEQMHELLERGESSQRVRIGLSVMFGRIGDLLQEDGRLDEALARHQDALAMAHKAFGETPASPDHRRQLALLHGRIGKLLEIKEDLAGARTHYERVLQLTGAATSNDRDSALVERDLTNALIDFGDLMSRTGDLQGALKSYQRVLDIRRAHRQLDTESATVARDLAVVLERLGTTRRLLKEYETAATRFRESLAITQELVEQDHENLELRRDLWINHNKLGTALMLAGENDQAAEQFDQALEIAQLLVRSGGKGIADAQGIAEAYDNLGTLEVRRLTPDTTTDQAMTLFRNAIAWYRKSLGVYERIEHMAPLTPQQKNLAKSIRLKIATIEQSMSKLEKAPH